MEFRMFTPEDTDECTALFLKVFTGEPWFDQWESFDHAKSYLREFLAAPRFIGFVALKEETIVGVSLGHLKTWWSGQEYFIDEFYIDNTFQGQGIGSGLLTYAEQILKPQGIKAFILLTHKKLPAEKFYLKNGFETQNDTIFMARNMDRK